MHPLPVYKFTFLYECCSRGQYYAYFKCRDFSCGSSRCGPWQIDAMDIAGREPLSAGWAPLLDPDGVRDALLAKDVATGSRRLLLHCIHADIASQFHLLSIR